VLRIVRVKVLDDAPIHRDSSPHRDHWTLDPAVTFLNHGSFGATPRVVLERQTELRARMESGPVLFIARELQAETDLARESLAEFLGAAARDLVPVTNATTAVNAVLRSLYFNPGDELLSTSHGYNACGNTLNFVADRAGASVVVADIPFPLRSADEIVDAVMSCVTERTRFALLDHVTSSTAVVYPVERLARELKSRGIAVMIDGAHAPGMLPLNLGELEAAGVDYYTGNCHKWMCAPKGAAFLWVKYALQEGIRPAVISHGANASTDKRTRFQLEFDWIGTQDPTAFLCIPDAIRCVGGLVPGGWDEVRAHNHTLVLAGRRLLLDALEIESPVPDELIGSITSLPIWDGEAGDDIDAFSVDEFQGRIFAEQHIEVPIFFWPKPPRRLLRISAQLYNSLADYEALARVLRAEARVAR
jgi:isopenicillin-N epimerase